MTMAADQPFLRFRALATMLLFVAALLVGSVDAVACEPEIEQSRTALVVGIDSDQAPAKSPDQKGGDACVHGHGHAGSQALATVDSLPMVESMRVAYTPVEPSSLGPPITHTDDRPPRA
jgi:hypothetical protein